MDADTGFMQKKYSIKELIDAYKQEIKALRAHAQTPADESKLQYYYQAVDTIGRSSLKDKVQFAMTFGRGTGGMVPQIREAFPMLLGNRVTQPSSIDLAYAKLLLNYTKAFNTYKGNIKDWVLRFVLTSRFSPVRQVIQREIDGVITHTEEKIAYYKTIT